MKSIFDHPAVKRVSAWAIMKDGAYAGRIIVAYPKDGAGIVRAHVAIFDLKGEVMQGSAGGCGYDKTSSAIHDAFYRGKFADLPDFDGRGVGAVETFLQSLGYQMFSAV